MQRSQDFFKKFFGGCCATPRECQGDALLSLSLGEVEFLPLRHAGGVGVRAGYVRGACGVRAGYVRSTCVDAPRPRGESIYLMGSQNGREGKGRGGRKERKERREERGRERGREREGTTTPTSKTLRAGLVSQ